MKKTNEYPKGGFLNTKDKNTFDLAMKSKSIMTMLLVGYAFNKYDEVKQILKR